MTDLFKTAAVPAVVPGEASTKAQGSVGTDQAYFENEIVLMGGEFNGKAYGSNFIVPGVEGVDYPTGIIAPLPLQEIYINMDPNILDETTANIIINAVPHNKTSASGGVDLVDKDGIASGVNITESTNASTWHDADGGLDSGNDSYDMYDEQTISYVYATNVDLVDYLDYVLVGLDDAKTYTIEVMACTNQNVESTYGDTSFSIDGHTPIVQKPYNNKKKESFTAVSPISGTITLLLRSTKDNGGIYINGINILEEA